MRGSSAPHEFDLVQAEIERRKGIGWSLTAAAACFLPSWSALIAAPSSGRKVWHSTDKYRKVIWRCNAKFKGEEKCKTPHLDRG